MKIKNKTTNTVLYEGSDIGLEVVSEIENVAIVDLEKVYTDAEMQKKQKMNTDYNGISISLTSEDQAGLLAVKAGFELGMERTVFRFENGTKMEMTPENFSAVASFFVKERSKFFQE